MIDTVFYNTPSNLLPSKGIEIGYRVIEIESFQLIIDDIISL